MATGATDLARFSARRARRLLPALFAVLLAMPLYALFLAQPFELDALRARRPGLAAYVANWNAIVARFRLLGRRERAVAAAAQPVEPRDRGAGSTCRGRWCSASEWKGRRLARARRGRRRRPGWLPPVLLVSLVFGALSLAVMLAAGCLGASTARLDSGSDTRFASILAGCALACLRAAAGAGGRRQAARAAGSGRRRRRSPASSRRGSSSMASAFVYRGGLVVLRGRGVRGAAAAAHPSTGPLAAAAVARAAARPRPRQLRPLPLGLAGLQLLGAVAHRDSWRAPARGSWSRRWRCRCCRTSRSKAGAQRSPRHRRQARGAGAGDVRGRHRGGDRVIRAPELMWTAFLAAVSFDSSRFVDESGRPASAARLRGGRFRGAQPGGPAARARRKDRRGGGQPCAHRLQRAARRTAAFAFPTAAPTSTARVTPSGSTAGPAELARDETRRHGAGDRLGRGPREELEGQWWNSCDAKYLGWYRPNYWTRSGCSSRRARRWRSRRRRYRRRRRHPSQSVRRGDRLPERALHLGLRAGFPDLAGSWT